MTKVFCFLCLFLLSGTALALEYVCNSVFTNPTNRCGSFATSTLTPDQFYGFAVTYEHELTQRRVMNCLWIRDEGLPTENIFVRGNADCQGTCSSGVTPDASNDYSCNVPVVDPCPDQETACNDSCGGAANVDAFSCTSSGGVVTSGTCTCAPTPTPTPTPTPATTGEPTETETGAFDGRSFIFEMIKLSLFFAGCIAGALFILPIAIRSGS